MPFWELTPVVFSTPPALAAHRTDDEEPGRFCPSVTASLHFRTANARTGPHHGVSNRR